MTDQTKPNAETSKSEMQITKSFDDWWASWPVLDADKLLLTDKGLASLAWRAALMSVKPETQELCGFLVELECEPCTGPKGHLDLHSKYCHAETQAGAMETRELFRAIRQIENTGDFSLDEHSGTALIATRDAKRDADARKIGETVALKQVAAEIEKLWCERKKSRRHPTARWMGWAQDVALALIPSDGQSLVDKNDAEIRQDEFRNTVIMCTTFPLEQMKVLIKHRAEELAALIPAQPEKPKV